MNAAENNMPDKMRNGRQSRHSVIRVMKIEAPFEITLKILDLTFISRNRLRARVGGVFASSSGSSINDAPLAFSARFTTRFPTGISLIFPSRNYSRVVRARRDVKMQAAYLSGDDTNHHHKRSDYNCLCLMNVL